MSAGRPTDVFFGTTMVLAPHMDDCVLACGGTLARLPERGAVHMVYVSDGRGVPSPELPWRDAVSDLRATRESEARAAMALLGLPEENVHFLGLPGGRLRSFLPRLHEVLEALLERHRPNVLLAPFRFDGDADHRAVHAAAAALVAQHRRPPRLFEYVVPSRWNLLRGGDVRRYLPSQRVVEIDLTEVADTKRAAMEMFRSQTTLFYLWQSRPALGEAMLERACREPEWFLAHDPEERGVEVLTRARRWIPIAQHLEPLLERAKVRVAALWRRSGSAERLRSLVLR
ncbi:MAG TPA: PIG-L family deacetylase [Candidatus Polarisedimenticolaceae bacterium]|nr:PIG-L family deacetylase [Candidatus Polarisedimenticolaceae bacterium]